MAALSAPVSGIANGVGHVATTAALVGALCWTLQAIEGYSGRSASVPARSSGGWNVIGEYDRSPDTSALEPFHASCERKLVAVVEKLGRSIGEPAREGLLRHIAHTVSSAEGQVRRVHGAFEDGVGYVYEYGCAQPAGQPVVAVVKRSAL
jgi:hypothetical protein